MLAWLNREIDEVKKNETKAQPLLRGHFLKMPGTPTQFTQLPDDMVESLSSFLSIEDKSNLMITSVSHYQFFKDSVIERLSHHVAYGEPKNAEIMAKHYPQLLLQTATIKVAHTGLELKMTPLQAAIYFKDQEMVAMFQKYMEPEEIEKQKKAQFPEGYEAYKEQEQKRINEGFKILKDTFDAIVEAKVTADDQDNLTLDEKAESAINRLRDYLKPKGVIETGQDITDVLLQKAFKLYDAYYDRFSIHTEEQALTYGSPKNMLAWRRIVGLCQFHLPLNYIQAFSGGLPSTTEKIEKEHPQGRALTFEIWNGSKYVKIGFRSMVSSSSAGLGSDYAVYSLRTVSRGNGLNSSVVPPGFDFSKLMSVKNSNLTELMRPTAHPLRGKTEMNRGSK